MELNIKNFGRDLRAAGLGVISCSSDGRVDFADGTSWQPGEPEDTSAKKAVAGIIAAHDPAPSYDERRRAEYPPTDEMVVALWERVVEGRPEASDALEARRQAVKAKYPKPGGGA